MRRPLDPRALEARTQAIGRQLFAAARREHAHLSVLNRWAAQVLSWCLSDPALKAGLLRFIDVLPALASPREIARHLSEYLPAGMRLPPALWVGVGLARSGIVTRGALAAVIRQLVERLAGQFIAERHPEGIARVIRALAERGAACSLDILGEQVLTEPEADRYAAQCQALLDRCADACQSAPSVPLCTPLINLSVKPSALTPRFDPISPTESVREAMRRLGPVLERAGAIGAVVNLDMEQYELRDLTLELAKAALLQQRPSEPPRLGLVIQAYLRDAEPVVEELLAWLAAHERRLIVRLVKGAYWDSELAQARQRDWAVPVHQDKAATDAAFERLTRRLLAAAPLVTTAIGSHNARSIAHAMAAAEALGLPRTGLEFQLLYGMGDALHGALASLGCPLRIYTPIGELIPGMAYLVRRILENTANESFLRQDFFEERDADALLREPHPAPPAERVCPEEDWRAEPFTDFSTEAGRAGMAQALAVVRGALGRHYPLLLGEEEVQTAAPLTVRNPAHPEQVIGLVSRADVAQAARAVELAREAQPRWAATPARERSACLRRAAALLRGRRLELAAWEVLEVGKTWREADADVVEAVEYLEYYAWAMEELAKGRRLRQSPGERNDYRYVPRGVAVVIAPWNFPAAILTGMASAALAAGNAVILKPAEQSPVTASLLARLLREAGIPPAVLQCLPGLGEEVGAALVRHPDVAAILFTGSKAVGLEIVQAAAAVAPGQRCVKRVIAEMGGKNAVIVDADADLDAAVAGVLRSAFGYGGQKCSAASRAIVHRAVYDRFLARLAEATDRLIVGDPAEPTADVGPLIDEIAQRRLAEAAARAAQVGRLAYQYPAARLPTAGHFVGPVVAAEVPPRDPLATEELFGPLLCVFRAESFAHALALANDTDYALTGGVYSRTPSHLARAVEAFDVGNLYLNRPITGALVGRQPFGGHRLSGLGTKAGGPDYLLQLVTPKTICANTTRHNIPLE